MRQRTKGTLTRWVAGLGAIALACGVMVSSPMSESPAYALELPTWEDVQAAKNDSAAAAAKVTEIQGLIAAGEQELERLRNAHNDAFAAFQTAEGEFMAAAAKADALETQATESRAAADAAAEQAASLVSQMYRSGGVDRNLELFLETDGDTADVLLERLAAMSKATERNTTISEQAEQAMNTAASLGEQAELARQEREALKAEKEELERQAAQAVSTQTAQIEAQEQQQAVLQAQLEALQDTEATTVAGYQERLRIEEEERQERIRQAAAAAAAAAEAARVAAEEAARRAAEEAAANAGGGGGGGGASSGGGSSSGGGGGSSSGWVVPIPYSYISTYFQQWWGHTGVDLVNGCGVPIRAANSGTVSLAGWVNVGGIMVYLNHGGGYQTRYAHLSGLAVGYGQWVEAGQVIGWVGTTGMSTGCHLHYEVLSGGVFIDPYGNGFV